jgi:hypothetical protein
VDAKPANRRRQADAHGVEGGVDPADDDSVDRVVAFDTRRRAPRPSVHCDLARAPVPYLWSRPQRLAEEEVTMSILWIILIVVLVLVVLGFFGFR